MKDKEFKFEEIEVSHTLGGVGEGRVQGRGKWRGGHDLDGVIKLLFIINRQNEN
jgi:hypothetical protein